MEMNVTKQTPETTQVAGSALQSTRFKERRQIEAQSDVRSDAVFYSPVVKIDTSTSTAVLQYRDEKTGEIQNEYPAKKTGVYKAAQEAVQKKDDDESVKQADKESHVEKAKTEDVSV